MIHEGVVHKVPTDLKKALLAHPPVLEAWQSLTPLARNERICWIESVKKQETRDQHITRAVEELTEGKRRPCCWMGCIHRIDKPISASQKWVLSKQAKKRQ